MGWLADAFEVLASHAIFVINIQQVMAQYAHLMSVYDYDQESIKATCPDQNLIEAIQRISIDVMHVIYAR